MMNQTAILSGVEAALLASVTNANNLQSEKKLYSYYEFDFSSLTDGGIYKVEKLVLDNIALDNNAISNTSNNTEGLFQLLKGYGSWEMTTALGTMHRASYYFFNVLGREDFATIIKGWSYTSDGKFWASLQQGLSAGLLQSIVVQKMLSDNVFDTPIIFYPTAITHDEILQKPEEPVTTYDVLFGDAIVTGTYTAMNTGTTHYTIANGGIVVGGLTEAGNGIELLKKMCLNDLPQLTAWHNAGIFIGVHPADPNRLCIVKPVGTSNDFSFVFNAGVVAFPEVTQSSNNEAYESDWTPRYYHEWTQIINRFFSNGLLGFDSYTFTNPIYINSSNATGWMDDLINDILADTGFMNSVAGMDFRIAKSTTEGRFLISIQSIAQIGGLQTDITTPTPFEFAVSTIHAEEYKILPLLI